MDLMKTSLKRLRGNLAKRQLFSSFADDLSTRTHFTQDECMALLNTHENLISRGNGKLDRGRFREFFNACFEITSDLMLDLIFRAFDRNGDGNVDPFEFVTGLSNMIRGNLDELTEFCYFIYDMNGDRSLAREELSQCLKGCLQPGYGLEPEEIESAERDIVELAMKKLDYDRDGQITFPDFQNAVRADPLLVIACGDCLPSDSCLARFLFTMTQDYRTYTGPLLGHGRNKISISASNRPSRFFPQVRASLSRSTKLQVSARPVTR